LKFIPPNEILGTPLPLKLFLICCTDFFLYCLPFILRKDFYVVFKQPISDTYYHSILPVQTCLTAALQIMCVTRKQWHKYESLVIYQPTDRLSNRIDDRFRRVWQSDLFRCNNLANVAFNILYITAANEKVLIVIVSINIGTL